MSTGEAESATDRSVLRVPSHDDFFLQVRVCLTSASTAHRPLLARVPVSSECEQACPRGLRMAGELLSRFQFHNLATSQLWFVFLTLRRTPLLPVAVSMAKPCLFRTAHGVGNFFAINRPEHRATLQICTGQPTSTLTDAREMLFSAGFFEVFCAWQRWPESQQNVVRTTQDKDRVFNLDCTVSPHRARIRSFFAPPQVLDELRDAVACSARPHSWCTRRRTSGRRDCGAASCSSSAGHQSTSIADC